MGRRWCDSDRWKFGEKCDPVLLLLVQIPHSLPWDRTGFLLCCLTRTWNLACHINEEISAKGFYIVYSVHCDKVRYLCQVRSCDIATIFYARNT